MLSGQYRIASAVTLADATLGVTCNGVPQQCPEARSELLADIAHRLCAAFGGMMTRLSTLPLDAYGRLRSCLNDRAREINSCVAVQGS
jgi:hypothetical protein